MDHTTGLDDTRALGTTDLRLLLGGLMAMANDGLGHATRQTLAQFPHHARHFGQDWLRLAQTRFELIEPAIKTVTQCLT